MQLKPQAASNTFSSGNVRRYSSTALLALRDQGWRPAEPLSPVEEDPREDQLSPPSSSSGKPASPPPKPDSKGQILLR